MTVAQMTSMTIRWNFSPTSKVCPSLGGQLGCNFEAHPTISPHKWISGWWFGTFFFQYVGNVIIPTDEVHHFSEG